MSQSTLGSTYTYAHEALPTLTSFRVLELLPGAKGDLVKCILHTVDWPCSLEFEAISYAWGDPKDTAVVWCHDKELQVTRSLQVALSHFRHGISSRFLWVDAICINQSDFPERGRQVKQMRRIYQAAQKVLIWLGPDEDCQAEVAVEAMHAISTFLLQKLNLSDSDLASAKDIYQEVIFKHRNTLPLPNDCDFSRDSTWKSLVWLYSHKYFTRVWVIQEINANNQRVVRCGDHSIDWNIVELVAGYMIMETAFSKQFGFSKAYCWYAAMVSTERIRQPRNWLFMLYLASNFNSTDARDAIYGLLGLLNVADGSELLKPDYEKPPLEVYADSVSAALTHFNNTDVLLYLREEEAPSWVPRWNRSMLFRNPFRFGRALPWKPAGDSQPSWNIDKSSRILSLQGAIIGTIVAAESYSESCFGNAMIGSEEGRIELQGIFGRILNALNPKSPQQPLDPSVLTAIATSLSFGLDEASFPADESVLRRNFVAFLKLALDDDTLRSHLPPDMIEEATQGNGHAFGKPVWDFKYPEAGIFIVDNGMIGCCIGTTSAGDTVYIPQGSTYPFVLRPDSEHYTIRGFSYVYGVMHGETQDSKTETVQIR